MYATNELSMFWLVSAAEENGWNHTSLETPKTDFRGPNLTFTVWYPSKQIKRFTTSSAGGPIVARDYERNKTNYLLQS